MNALHMTSACKPSLARVAARPAQRAQRVAAQAAATEPKLLAKSPIPAFIPRDDLMQQIHRWANVEVVGNGASNFGMACTMEELFREADDGQTWPWGLLINLERDGEVVCELKMSYDMETTNKHAFIGKHPNGMPKPQGEITDVLGAHFEVYKLDEREVDQEIRSAVKGICSELEGAFGRYYAFGSVFSEEI